MRKLKKRLFTIAFVVNSVIACASMVEAARIVRIKKPKQNIRSKAKSGSVLGRARKGQRFVVNKESGSWLRVHFRGREGWVYSRDVAKSSGSTLRLKKTQAARSQASPTASKRGTARAGQSYVVLARRGSWTQIQFSDKTAWVEQGASGNSSAPASTPSVAAVTPNSGSSYGSATQRARSLLNEREGFGRQTVGGDPKQLYRVTTLKNSGQGSLRAALESSKPYWIVFAKSGTIKLSTPIKVKSNKTVDGRGRSVLIDGGLRIDRARNIIISDVRVRNKKDDAILVWSRGGNKVSDFESRDLWFHHLELYGSRDGLIDLRAATNVTISWCHFHSHAKSLLIWKDRSGKRNLRGVRVTMHHNYFQKTSRRNPNFNYGKLDFFNNYIERFYEYGLGCFEGAEVLSENNIYEARPGYFSFAKDPNTGDRDYLVSKKATVFDWGGRKAGSLRSRGDQAKNGAQVKERKPGSVFKRSQYYSAKPEKAGASLERRLKNECGPR